MFIQRLLLAFILPGLAITPAVAQQPTISPLVSVLAIAHKGPKQVDGLLGRPSKKRQERGRHGMFPVREYQHGSIQITFIKDKAEWIDVYPSSRVPFKARAILGAVSLPYQEPNFSNQTKIQWHSLAGMLQIYAFSSPKGVNFIHISVSRDETY